MKQPISLRTLQRYREIALKEDNIRLYQAFDLVIAEYLQMSDGHLAKQLERYDSARARKPYDGRMRDAAAERQAAFDAANAKHPLPVSGKN